MSTESQNMALMQTLDDAWNAQDWNTFDARHTSEVIVRWHTGDSTRRHRPRRRLVHDAAVAPRESVLTTVSIDGSEIDTSMTTPTASIRARRSRIGSR